MQRVNQSKVAVDDVQKAEREAILGGEPVVQGWRAVSAARTKIFPHGSPKTRASQTLLSAIVIVRCVVAWPT